MVCEWVWQQDKTMGEGLRARNGKEEEWAASKNGRASKRVMYDEHEELAEDSLPS